MRYCKILMILVAFVLAVVLSSCLDDTQEDSFCTLDSDCSQGLVCIDGVCVYQFAGDWDRQRVDGDIDFEMEMSERIDGDVDLEEETPESIDGDIDLVESVDSVDFEDEFEQEPEEEPEEEGCFFAVRPEVIEFERVLVGSESSQEIILYNHCQDDVLIDSFEKVLLEGDSGCDEFEIVDEYGLQGEIIEGVVLSPKKLKLVYSPVDEGSDTCHLRIKSDMLDHPEFDIPMTGTGRVQHRPVAIVSLQSQGPPIPEPIEIVEPTTICFYGDSSYDPDCNPEIMLCLQEYRWMWREVPEGASLDMIPVGTYPYSYMGFCADFNVYGTYRFSLVVVDYESLESEPFEVTVILRPVSQNLYIVMTYTTDSVDSERDSQVDVDLALHTSAYLGICSDDHLDDENYCDTLEGGECWMDPDSPGIETICCDTLLDAPWQITASLIDDCSDAPDSDPRGECPALQDTQVTIEVYDSCSGPDQALIQTMTTELTETNLSKNWMLILE